MPPTNEKFCSLRLPMLENKDLFLFAQLLIVIAHALPAFLWPLAGQKGIGLAGHETPGRDRFDPGFFPHLEGFGDLPFFLLGEGEDLHPALGFLLIALGQVQNPSREEVHVTFQRPSLAGIKRAALPLGVGGHDIHVLQPAHSFPHGVGPALVMGQDTDRVFHLGLHLLGGGGGKVEKADQGGIPEFLHFLRHG